MDSPKNLFEVDLREFIEFLERLGNCRADIDAVNNSVRKPRSKIFQQRLSPLRRSKTETT